MPPEAVAAFLRAHTVPVPGAKVRLADLYDAFMRDLPATERPGWSKPEFCRALDLLGVERGRSGAGQVCIANLALPTHRYTVRDGRLSREPVPA